MKKQIAASFIISAILIQGCSVKNSEYGVKDDKLQATIADLNKKDELYKTKRYQQIAKMLEFSIGGNNTKTATKLSQLHELADIYSYYLFDLEKAVEIDHKIQNIGLVEQDKSGTVYSNVSNNTILTNQEYAQKYLNLEPNRLLIESKERLANNIKLLEGNEVFLSNRKYSESFLAKNLDATREDFDKCIIGSKEYYMIFSRMIKNEYLLYKLSRNSNYLKAYELLKNKTIKLDSIYFDEVDFLMLTNYLLEASQKNNSIYLAELALATIYKPYKTLKNEANKWTYNKLINSIINKIVTTAYSQQNFKDALYYMSLNKSRMIIEERFSTQKDSVDNDRAGKLSFPSKQEFYSIVNKTENYLDYYIVGDYEDIASVKSKNKTQSKSESTISLKIASVDSKTFSSTGAYIAYIDSGKLSMLHLNQASLGELEKNVDKLYESISNYNSIVRSAKKRSLKLSSITQPSNIQTNNTSLAKLLPKNLNTSKPIVISTDKWLGKIPFDVLGNLDGSRTLNIFTLNTEAVSQRVEPNILGYFNPIKDLSDAEDEIPLIAKYHTNFKYFKRDDASKDKLNEPMGQNILHLSMHGFNDAEDPEYSKMLFAKSVKGITKYDTNALYAKDIANYTQLKNNKLVFTAACETGLTKSSHKNSEELLGILRPLLMNNNENIILTLWEIDSESAKKFVEYFYSNLAVTKNIQTGFLAAKQQLKAEYKDPYFWAPYYIITQKGVDK